MDQPDDIEENTPSNYLDAVRELRTSLGNAKYFSEVLKNPSFTNAIIRDHRSRNFWNNARFFSLGVVFVLVGIAVSDPLLRIFPWIVALCVFQVSIPSYFKVRKSLNALSRLAKEYGLSLIHI